MIEETQTEPDVKYEVLDVVEEDIDDPSADIRGERIQIPDTVEPACKVHGCKVNPLVWSIFGWSRTEWAFI